MNRVISVYLKLRLHSTLALVSACLLSATAVYAQPKAARPITALNYAKSKRYKISIEDKTSWRYMNPGIRESLHKDIETALNSWLEHIEARGAVSLVIRFDPTEKGRATGRSVRSSFLKEVGGHRIYEQAVVAKLLNRVDKPSNDFDIELIIDPGYLKELWFDPEPTRRISSIPRNKLDAVSVFMHEIGHALAFNGWLDQTTGKITSRGLSSFDRNVRFIKDKFYFYGPHTMKVYGGPVVLGKSRNNYHHLGDTMDDDSRLVDDLMNGVVMKYQKRYFVSKLDLAVLKDCGIPCRVATSQGP